MVSEGIQLVEKRTTGAYPDFDMLLATLSTRFINLPTEQIDSGIEERKRHELVDPILLTRSSIGILPSRIKGLYFNLTPALEAVVIQT